MKKKYSVIKKKNALTLIIVIIIGIFLALISLNYAINKHFEQSGKSENAGSRPSFYADEKNQMDLTLPGDSADTSLNSLTYKVSLQNKMEGFSVCKYNLYYYWDEDQDGYYHISNNDEITLTGIIDGKTIFENIQLNDYNLDDNKTLLSSYYIANDGATIANQTWNIMASFHPAQNQDNILNKTYFGKIGVDDVVCSDARYLKDEVISNNNYICLNSTDEYCTSDKLYQIISITDEGIKVVKTSSSGVASWSDDLLLRISDSFLKGEGKYLKGMIEDFEWSLSDDGDNMVQVNSKIGLLSEEEYNNLAFLDNYEKPYLVLSHSGILATENGLEKNNTDVGYVYPVFYLNKDAIVSKGDGSEGNPYFVN